MTPKLPTIRIYKFFPILLQIIFYIPAWIVGKFFFQIRFEGVENIKDINSKLIFAANHSSELDSGFVRLGLPMFWGHTPMYYVARGRSYYHKVPWYRRVFYGGTLFKLFGAYPAFKGYRRYAYSLRNHIQILKENKGCVCIYPEGKKATGHVFNKAHGGLGYLAHRTKASVVPVAIKGAHLMNFKNIILRKHTIIVKYGTPLKAKNLLPVSAPSIEDFKVASQHVLNEIENLYNRAEKTVL
jgi:1-acyl-sn-glycerol-3-phosphate acyltransferase